MIGLQPLPLLSTHFPTPPRTTSSVAVVSSLCLTMMIPSHFHLIGQTLQRNFMRSAGIKLMKLLLMTPLLRLILHHRHQGGMCHSLLHAHPSLTRHLLSTDPPIHTSLLLPVVLRLHLPSIHHPLPLHQPSTPHHAIYSTLPPSGINFFRQFHPWIYSLSPLRWLPLLHPRLGDPTVFALLHLRLHLAAPHVAPNHGISCILLL